MRVPLAIAMSLSFFSVAAPASAATVIGSFTPSATFTFDEASVPPTPVPSPFSITESGITASFAGQGGIVTNSNTGYYQAPAGDTTNYLSTKYATGGPGSETVTFSSDQTRLGLLWGSIDKYNSLTFYLAGVPVDTFSGTSLGLIFDGFGNSGVTEYVYLAVNKFDSIGFTTGQAAFEVDNLTVSAVPEPATWALMLAGFAGLGFAAFRQTKRSETLVLA